jgi:hypothetical protein
LNQKNLAETPVAGSRGNPWGAAALALLNAMSNADRVDIGIETAISRLAHGKWP